MHVKTNIMNSSTTMTAMNANVSQGTQDVQMLVFKVQEEQFAIPLTEIQEIMKVLPLTPVPHAPPAIHGIMNVRSKVVTAIDMATVLGISNASSKPEHMILAAFEKNLYALLVDTVVGVVRTSSDHLRTTPDLFAEKSAATYVSAALMIPQQKAESHDNQNPE